MNALYTASIAYITAEQRMLGDNHPGLQVIVCSERSAGRAIIFSSDGHGNGSPFNYGCS